MTAYYEDNRFEEVFGPEDVADIRRKLERGRWWRFLNAKDKLLGALSKARRFVTGGFRKATDALHISGVVVSARRLVRRGAVKAAPVVSLAKAAGVVPSLAWAATTERGRRVITRTSRAVIRAAVTAVRSVTRWTGRAVRFFGPRGDQLADRVATFARQTALRVAVKVASVVGPLRMAWVFRDLAFQAAGAWGRQRALSGLLGHFLPRRWARVAKLLTTVLVVPGSVLRQLLGVVVPPKVTAMASAVRSSTGRAAEAPRARVVRAAPMPMQQPVVTEDIRVEEDLGWLDGEHVVTPVSGKDVTADQDIATPAVGDDPAPQHLRGHGTAQRRIRHLDDEDRVGSFSRYPASKRPGRKRN